MHFGFADVAARWKSYQRAILVPRPPTRSGGLNIVPGDAESSDISYLNQLANYRLLRLDTRSQDTQHTSGVEATPRQLGRSQVGSNTVLAHSTLPQQMAEHPEQSSQSSWSWSAANTQLNDLAALPPGDLPGFTGWSDFSVAVDDDYYNRLAGHISDYITWDGSFGAFDVDNVFETTWLSPAP